MFEEDVAARKKLAELLVGEPNARPAIINAVLRDVATKTTLKNSEEHLERRALGLNSVSMAWKRELESRKRGLQTLRSVST